MKELSVIRGKHLKKRYGKREVVHDISITVEQGSVTGLLGPNGAGKTTTFYMLAGIVSPTAGTVHLDDCDLGKHPLHERARMGMTYLPQESSVFKKLTVRQNLEIVFEHTSLPASEQKSRISALLEELGIMHLADQAAMHLSGGERRRLEIARALVLDPHFILLDEPFAGIDPIAVDDIQAIVADLKKKGIGVLISDHNVRETLSICDKACLVFEGRVILSGTPETIIADPRARKVYLGEKFSL